ncbi:MAG: flavin reductase family protein [Alphaproteobacteria bacterium]
MAFITVDPAVDLRPAPFRHNPFKAIVSPRPIGWITTLSATGVVNLAPFSYFNAVCDNPHCVIYGVNGAQPEDGGAKDSLQNVEATKEFVCNVVSWDLREQMNLTSAHVPRSVSEMAEAGLDPAPSVKVKPPRVAASPAQLECRYLQTVQLPSHNAPGNHLVIGEVVAMHVDERVIVDGRIDMMQMKTVARLGYMDYSVVDNVFAMNRPD